MGFDHMMVGALTAASIAFLVWIEIRSRRNSADQEGKKNPQGSETSSVLNRPGKTDAA